ncbi:B3 domain-containing transcription factor VRN1 [Eucalyptus grandis]|uniref:B3 domain-containing transcription factor VRN1 n=1 Tax=Eucalyptus grandis TaxID=71139 RepID=UPI00192E9BE6|nr:B3 domain-containing transcription factor VRN1 [Eucalyptus grandis]
MGRRSRHRRRREGGGAEPEMDPGSPPSSPHFFKIVLSRALESGKLGIPKSFLRRYGKDLSGLVLLKVPGGSTWPVKLEKSDDGKVWLWKGWRGFMEHYSIGHGHLLVFKYEGDSVFHVIIFDKSASEIDYPSSIESDMSSPEEEFISRKEEDVVEIKDSEGSVPCSQPSSDRLSREYGVPSLLAALELASDFKSDHPFFKVVIQPTYVRKSLTIPREFFIKHVQKNKQIATLRYSDRSWQVKLRTHEHTACLSTGWSSFARENDLLVGDCCVFELIDRDDIVFRVSIFRSDGQILTEQSQCQEHPSESAFHTSPCLSPVIAHERACEFESEYPFCNVVISPSHIKRQTVTIPWQFIKTYIQKDHQMVNVVYLGRSFEVNLRVYRHLYIAFLGVGWSALAREAHLRKGDVCMFELLDRDNIVLRVSVFSSANKEVICIE